MDSSTISRKSILILCALIVFSLIAVLNITAIFAEDVSDDSSVETAVLLSSSLVDINGHWGETAIRNAVAEGYVNGYPDGTFLPDKPITRAEFVRMINTALGLRDENKVQLLFTDIKTSDWFYNDIAKASYVRYIQGRTATTFAPDANITRQEAAVMVSRFLPKAGMTSLEGLAAFPDRTSIDGWAENGLAITVNKGYLKGHNTGFLAPLGNLTRVQAVAMIDKILENETIVREDVFVRTSGEILKDTIYVGDITIAESVGEGDATFQNLSALGVVYVNGGGSHTVEMQNSLIIRLVVTKEGTEVRVLAADGTTIYTSIIFNDNLLVDGEGEEGEPGTETFEDIIIINGDVSEEDARSIADAINQQIQSSGRIDRQRVADAVLGILGGSTASTQPSGTIVVDVPGTIDGGGGPVISGVTVTGDTDYITSTLSAIVAPEAATAAYQWMRADAEDGTYEDIEGATSADYNITEDDIGKYLKVVASGTVDYDGIRTSAAVGVIGFDGGSGSEEDPFEVANWYHLNNIRYILDADYILTEDLGAPIAEIGTPMPDPEDEFETKGYEELVEGGWDPIGNYSLMPEALSSSSFQTSGAIPMELFTGTFDGNDKIIADLIVREGAAPLILVDISSSAGLFAVIYQSEIKDLRLQDPMVEGDIYVGALVGYSRESMISNIVIEESVEDLHASRRMYGVLGEDYVGGIAGINDAGTIEYSSNEIFVEGERYVGGIAGGNTNDSVESTAAIRIEDPDPEVLIASITACFNAGTVRSLDPFDAIALPWDPSYCAGGIAGAGDGTISESYNTGFISSEFGVAGGLAGQLFGTVENSYNKGTVAASSYFGGIAGYASEATFVDNYNVGELDDDYFDVDSLWIGTAEEICGYDRGLDDPSYDPSVFTGNFYKESMLRSADIGIPGCIPVFEEELRNPLTFTLDDFYRVASDEEDDWDFTNVWAMNLNANEGFPFHRWAWNADDFDPITLDVTMPTAGAITYNVDIADIEFEGGSVEIDGVPVDGDFEYWPDFYAGTYEPEPNGENGEYIYLLFTPDTFGLQNFVGHIYLTVNKATPTVDVYPTASSITYGDTLADSVLGGGSMEYLDPTLPQFEDVPGSFAFKTPATMPDAGTYEATVTFTPTQTWLYNTVDITVDVEVEQREITVTALTDTKVYNGTTASSPTPVITSGTLVPGQAGSWSQTYDNKNVGVGKILTPAGTVATNPGAINVTPNYDITFATTTGAITVRTLTLSDFGANDKTYDGTTNVSGDGFDDNRVFGDELSFTYTAAFNSKMVGERTVNFTDIAISGGADRNNYTLASTTGSTGAAISQKSLTITADSNSKDYDCTALTDSGYSSSGLVAGDSLSGVTVTGTITTPGAVSNVLSGGVVYDGFEGNMTGNYSISRVNGTLTVNKATPSVTWPTIEDMARDQLLSAAITSGGSATTVCSGSTVPLAGSFAFESPSTSYPTAGAVTAPMVFTPTNTDYYNTVTSNRPIDVLELIFESIDVTYGSPDITLNFNLRVNKASTLYSAGDISIMIIKANGDEIEYQPKQIIQPNGTDDSFLIRLDSADAPEAGDTVIVEIRPSGADKIIDAGGHSLTGTLTRSRIPAFELINVESIDRNDNTFVDGIKLTFNKGVNDSSMDFLSHWTIEYWDTGGAGVSFNTGETVNDEIFYVYLPEGEIRIGTSFNVDTDGEWITSADGTESLGDEGAAWNGPVTNVFPD